MNFSLESEHLYIRPLSYMQLMLYIESPDKLANSPGFNFRLNTIDPVLTQTVLTEFYPYIDIIQSEFLFHTLWLIILKSESAVVGFLCFHNEPFDGTVEIGYGTDLAYRNKGIMKEAIGMMIAWAKKRDDIQQIIAFTDADNFPSQKVLIANGFCLNSEANENGLLSWTTSIRVV